MKTGHIILYFFFVLASHAQTVKQGTNEIYIIEGTYHFAQEKSTQTKPAHINDVYSRFKVASTDYQVDGITVPLSWLDAVSLAGDIIIDGEKGWRLPTKYELMLIYTVNSQLKNPLEISNAAIPSCFYWSSTQKSSAHAWFVTYLNGQSSAFSKKYHCRVRLIKDL